MRKRYLAGRMLGRALEGIERAATRDARKLPAHHTQDELGHALEVIQEFNVFLHRGAKTRPRALSPHRALEHLKDVDVRELLGEERVREIRQAAELLTGARRPRQ